MAESMVLLIEAATDLGISVPTLYRTLAREGIPTFRKIGDRRAYIRTEDLENLRGFRQHNPKKEAA